MSQNITKFHPVRYLIEIMRMIILKGSDLKNILGHLGILVLFAIG